MRPLATMDGMPRAASARRKLGHSSVSMPMKKRGRTASSARRTGPGRSTGKYRWLTLPSSLSATMRAPVGVTVVMTMPSSGHRRASASTRGTDVTASPTETAWIQHRGSAGRSAP